MIEMIMGGGGVTVPQTPGSYVPPPMDAKTLFRLSGFKSTADLVDRSKNKIPVGVNGDILTGQDSIQSYIEFNAGKWLTVSSPLLNQFNVELTFVVGDVQKLNTAYDPPLIDTRPLETNGFYHIFSIQQTVDAPHGLLYNYPSTSVTTIPTTIGLSPWPTVIRLQLFDSVTKIYVNDTLVYNVNKGSYFDSTNLKIGRSAFYAAVPEFHGKLYFFEIKSLT